MMKHLKLLFFNVFFIVLGLVFFLGVVSVGAEANQADSNNYLSKSHYDSQDYSEAISRYKKAIEEDASNSENYYHIGKIYSKQGQYEEAISWYKKGIEVNSANSHNYSGMGWVYRYQGNYLEAIRSYEQVIKINPNNIDGYEGLGQVYFNLDDYPQAIKWFEEGIKIAPKDSHTYNELGCAYRDQGNYSQAIRCFRKTIELARHDSRGYEGLGKTYYNMRNYSKAIKWLNEAKKFCIDCDQINEGFARIYIDQGKYAKAEEILNSIVRGKSIEEFRYWGCPFQALGELYNFMNISEQKRKVIENYIKSADIEKYSSPSQYSVAEICYKYGDYENAEKYIERAINLVNDIQHLNKYLILRGYILISTKRYQEAELIFKQVLNKADQMQIAKAKVGVGHIELTRHNYKLAAKYFQEMLCLERDDHMANLGMAWINSNQNKHQQALSYYEILLKKDPFYILALLGKGNALMGLKRMSEAEVNFKQVLKIDPENEYAFAELGILAYNKDQDIQAEQLFQTALKRNNSTYTCPYEGLGLVYLKQNRLKEAEENFNRAITLNPNIEYKKYNGLSRIYIKQGKISEAKELLKKSIQNYPYDNEAKELLEELDAKTENR